MNYILKGDPKEVAKVLQENRIRADRGVIEFTPCQPDSALDADSIATLRTELEAKTNECVEMAADQLVLANLAEAVADIVVENGIVIPDDLSAQLAKFITVPKVAETVPNDSPNVENAGSNVPETVPNEPEAVEDNKTVDAGTDMKEVNLDDVKDAPEEEAKAEPAPASKKTRSKKSE
jgi:hypothetical protein